MQFSTRSEYGLRALTVLGNHYGSGPVPLRRVAEHEGLSEDYLEQLFADLKRAHLLRTVRGAGGGYLLAKPPEELNLREIVTALEGDIAPCDCVREDGDATCLRGQTCLVQAVWFRLRDSMNDILEGITLSDVLSGKL